MQDSNLFFGSFALWKSFRNAAGFLGILPPPRTLLWDSCDGGHRRSLDDWMNQHCPIQLPTDVGSRTNNWVQNDCVQHPRVQIFTDALKKSNGTGYAFMAIWADVVIGEGGGALGNVSVFQAEVVAIQAVLLWLILNPLKLKGTKVKLWSDSQSALQSISLKPSSKLVEDTKVISVGEAHVPNRVGLCSWTLRCYREWGSGSDGERKHCCCPTFVPCPHADREGNQERNYSNCWA